ncbi:MAG: DUF2232 domain-containing protein [Gemmatimonadota bacterium]
MAMARERRWLRPLGLFALAMTLAIGQPFVLVAVAFTILTILSPGGRFGALALAAVGFAVVFAGEPGGGLWYLERGWAIHVGGLFAALTLWHPERPFLPRAVLALVGASVAGGALLLAVDGWSVVEGTIVMRLQEGATATVELMGATFGREVAPAVGETIAQTVNIQTVLFPALVGLSSLASLGVAWWLHLRLATGSDRGLAGLREFRFPDPMVWILIAGLALVMVAGWSMGWGRVGTNLLAFMGALYVVRGAAVLLFLSGGLSLGAGLLLAVGLLLAAPVLIGGAVLIGLGDSWLDIRARLRRGEDQETT